ncbi:lipid-A-disaccharide synthase [Pelosinus propionicus]|uniref:Lipid-A-disaccharide synthase n=1 Tax=Pelosinus propionicus DSM 13327 TaxID=1123291 RepID=A0A1I4J5U9_9FIRM|nr:lipid-A-disaccharide synthase [Pelosinus propionicus]SFL61939.1 lipid-A-disaccharide synthase [Pelosinus propionicus DSM 13327]
MCKIMISVGEASGDLHGASVARALKTIQPSIKLFGMGGKAMAEAGVEIVYDIADLGVIGFVEVIKNLPRLFKLRDDLAELMEREKPDALVVIDYPDFNMRLAKIAKQKGIPVISYISPSVWAWRKGRAKEVAKIVEKVAAIFPFEAEAYKEAGANVAFVGHPLLDIVKPTMPKHEAYQYFEADSEKPIVLLLPGSRQQEITSLLPVMLAAGEKIAEKVPECQFFLPVASTISWEMLHSMIKQYKINVVLTEKNTYDLMNIGNVAIAASGTVTLEASLLNLPTVIIYKLATFTYLLGRLLVKIPYISLPNIIAGRKVVPELLQHAVTADNIANETTAILLDPHLYKTMLHDLAEVKNKLGEVGAVERVAREILAVGKGQGLLGGQK